MPIFRWRTLYAVTGCAIAFVTSRPSSVQSISRSSVSVLTATERSSDYFRIRDGLNTISLCVVHTQWICIRSQCLTVLIAFVYNIRQSTWQQRCNRLHGLDPSKSCHAIQHFQYKLWQLRKEPVFIRTSARTQSAHIDQMSVMNQFWTEAVLIQNTLSFDFSRWW